MYLQRGYPKCYWANNIFTTRGQGRSSLRRDNSLSSNWNNSYRNCHFYTKGNHHIYLLLKRKFTEVAKRKQNSVKTTQ